MDAPPRAGNLSETRQPPRSHRAAARSIYLDYSVFTIFLVAVNSPASIR